MHDALGRLLGPEPDGALVRRIKAVAPALGPAEVRASLRRLRITIDVPQVRVEPPVEPQPGPIPRTTTAPARRERSEAGTPWRAVTLAQLVEGGLVRLPCDLEVRYRGKELSARIERPARIVFDGQPYDSLSTAGGMARKSVIGSPPGRAYPQTNGWTFWRCRRADGSLGMLDELRRQLHERKVVRLDDARRAGA